MGEQAVQRAATPEEVGAMRRLALEALEAGALGFATSKSPTHVGYAGNPVPSRAADFEEIRSLKDNLEQQVLDRTRDLSRALSDLKRAQVQLIESEKQAMLGRLVAGMAHEINTPLGTLRSSVDTLGRVVSGYRRYVETQSGHARVLGSGRLTRS